MFKVISNDTKHYHMIISGNLYTVMHKIQAGHGTHNFVSILMIKKSLVMHGGLII